LSVAGQRWQLLLPSVIEPTAPVRANLRLRFKVSRDEEFAALDVIEDETIHPLQPRKHHYLLLTLARLRRSEHMLPPTRRGWIDQDDLANQLQLSTQNANVHVLRARPATGAGAAHLASPLRERRGPLHLARS